MAETKKLKFWILLLVGINAALDIGLLFMPSVGASFSGPFSIFAWSLLALVFLYIAACFAELVSIFPTAGGVYEFGKQTYGRLPSFIIGWLAWLIGTIAIAMLIVGAVLSLFPQDTQFFAILRIVLVFGLIIGLNYVTYRGLKLGVAILVIFALLSISLFAALIVTMFFNINLSNIFPVLIHPTFYSNTVYYLISLFFVSEVFFGIEGTMCLSEETEDPSRTMPKAIIYAFTAVCAIIVLFVVSSLFFMNWSVFSEMSAPFTVIIPMLFGALGGRIFSIIISLVIFGTAVGAIVTTPYLLMAMSRDKVFLPHFAKKHPKYDTPSKSILLQTIVASFFAVIGVLGGYTTLVALVVPASIFLYIIIILIVPILRFKRPHDYRYFKVPFGKVIPVLIALFLVLLIVIWLKLEPSAWHLLKLLFGVLLLGVPIYFLIEMYYNPRMITSVNDILSYFTLFVERIILPIKIRDRIISYLGDIHNKNVLEFGCSIGTLTVKLAEAVQYGKIYAIDHSKNDLKIAQRRMDQLGHAHVKITHDKYSFKRIHPDVPYVDAAVSVGNIGYSQDTIRFLRELNKRLKLGGRICIMDYDKFFRLIPNVPWLADDNVIRGMFSECGFRVSIKREQGLFWQYVYIFGQKIKEVYKYYYI